MVKVLPCILLLLICVACSSDVPRGKPQPPEPYVIEASTVEPGANHLIVSIKLDPPFTEETAKKAAEIVVERNRAQFKNITVRSYTRHVTEDPKPFAVSVFDGNNLTHQFNPQLVPQKIPSH